MSGPWYSHWHLPYSVTQQKLLSTLSTALPSVAKTTRWHLNWHVFPSSFMTDFCNLLKRICHLRLIKHLRMKKRKQCQPNSNLYSTARLQLWNVLVFGTRLILLIRSCDSWRNDSLGNHNTGFLIVFLYSIRQTKFNEQKVIVLICMMTCKYSLLPSLVGFGWNKPQNP